MSRILSESKFEAEHAAHLAMTAAAGALSGTLRAGTRVPLFELPDVRGNQVSFDQVLGAGPVVLNFLRGAWCAFGEESLVQLAATYERIVSAGAAAFAISPPGQLASIGQSVPIPELIDRDMKVARMFGLAFELPVELRPRYLELGYIPPKTRKSDSFLVPIPATYLIDHDGVIVLAHIDADYRHHLDNEALLGALNVLQARSSARERVARSLTGKWRFGRDL